MGESRRWTFSFTLNGQYLFQKGFEGFYPSINQNAFEWDSDYFNALWDQEISQNFTDVNSLAKSSLVKCTSHFS